MGISISVIFLLCSAVDALFDLSERNAVFERDVLGIADALGRKQAHLEAAFAVVDSRDKARSLACTLDLLVERVHAAREVMHVGVENTTRAEVAHSPDNVLRDEQTLGDACCRKALVEQHNAALGRLFENLRKPLALLAQTSEVDGVVLVGGEMRENIVAGADRGALGRHVNAKLREKHRDTPSLCKYRLSAAVRARQNEYAHIVVEVNIVCDDIDILAARLVDRELEVVQSLERAVALFGRQDLSLAYGHTRRHDFLDKLSPADIKEDLGHEINEHIAADVDIAPDRVLDLVDRLLHDVGDGVLDSVRERIRARYHRGARVNSRHVVIQLDLAVELNRLDRRCGVENADTARVGAVVKLVLAVGEVHETAHEVRLAVLDVVERNNARRRRSEHTVEVYADSYALYAAHLLKGLVDVLPQLGKAAVG